MNKNRKRFSGRLPRTWIRSAALVCAALLLITSLSACSYVLGPEGSASSEDTTPNIGNEGNDSFRDMQLMSLCRHNIIANSTFSQWGALLNGNEEHITVYPASYLKDRDNEMKHFDGWVRL